MRVLRERPLQQIWGVSPSHAVRTSLTGSVAVQALSEILGIASTTATLAAKAGPMSPASSWSLPCRSVYPTDITVIRAHCGRIRQLGHMPRCRHHACTRHEE
jgi:hypothetical protein